MGELVVTAAIVAELAMAVESAYGETPNLRAICVDPFETPRLAYIGANPGFVAYELSVILATSTAEVAYRAGYEYAAIDIVEEVRRFLVIITPSRSRVMGHEVVFYWPSIAYDGDRLGCLGCG